MFTLLGVFGWALVAAAMGAAAPGFLGADGVVQLERAFYARGGPGGAEALEAATAAALASCADCFEVLWRSARTRFWQAESTPQKELKGRLGKEGWDLAEKAILLEPMRVEGWYYAAINIGIYAEAVGMWSSLAQGLDGKFLARVGKALAIAPHAERSGPLLAMGRYYYNVPWPKRDLRRAESFYRWALEAHPDNLRGVYYLAQALAQAGRWVEAQTAISRVYSTPNTADPADGERIQSWALATQAYIEKKLRR